MDSKNSNEQLVAENTIVAPKPVKQVVIPEDIEAHADIEGTGRAVRLGLEPMQNAAFRLLIGTAIFAASITVLLVIGCMTLWHRFPEQGDLILERTLKLFDVIVVKGTGTPFTALLTYLFVKQSTSAKPD